MPPLPYPGRFEPSPLNFKIAIKYASFYGLVFHFLCSPIFSQQQHYSKTFTEAGAPVAAEGRADSIAHIFIRTSSLCSCSHGGAIHFNFTPARQWR